MREAMPSVAVFKGYHVHYRRSIRYSVLWCRALILWCAMKAKLILFHLICCIRELVRTLEGILLIDVIWQCRKQERLEFLYDSGLQVGKVAQADEYLLGKPVEEAVKPESDVGQVRTSYNLEAIYNGKKGWI